MNDFVKNDYSDYLSPSEIDLELWIQSRLNADTIVLTSNIQQAYRSSEAIPLLNYLLVILPIFLNQKHGLKVDQSLQTKIIGTEPHYKKFLEPFLDALDGYGYNRTDRLRNELAFRRLPFTSQAWVNLLNAIYKYRMTIKKQVSEPAWKIIRTIFGIMVNSSKDEPLNEETLLTIISDTKNMPNKLLGKWVASANPTKGESTSKEELKVAKRSVDDITDKYLNTDDPSPDELKSFQEKNPEKYKEYRKAILATKKAAKKVIAEEFEKHGHDLIDVDTARNLLMRLGIPCPIDENFVGKVAIGTTDSMIFSYYTIYGKKLDCVVGKNVKMNPNYDQSDNTYYCTHLPFISKKGVPIKVYSEDHWKKSKEKLYNGLRSCLPVLEDVRSNFSSTVKPLLNGNFDNVPALAALVMKVISETAGRIGNAGSVNEAETFGIHNLQVRHVASRKAGILLKYIGKKGVPQEHIVRDPISISCIKKLVEGRKKTQYVFSKDGEKPVSPTSIVEYLKSTGFPASPHMFRKIWAAKIFNEEGLKKIPNRKITEKEAKEIFNKAAEAVAKKLGQTEKNTSIKSYIDPLLMMTFWKRVGYKMPKNVQTAYDKIAEQNPNSDED